MLVLAILAVSTKSNHVPYPGPLLPWSPELPARLSTEGDSPTLPVTHPLPSPHGRVNFTAYFDPFKRRWFSHRARGVISSRRAHHPSSPWERTKSHFGGRTPHWKHLWGRGARSGVRRAQHTPLWSDEWKRHLLNMPLSWCSPLFDILQKPHLLEMCDCARGSGFASKNWAVCASLWLFSANKNMTQQHKTRRKIIRNFN